MALNENGQIPAEAPTLVDRATKYRRETELFLARSLRPPAPLVVTAAPRRSRPLLAALLVIVVLVAWWALRHGILRL